VRAALPVNDAAGLIAGASSSHLHLVSRTGSVYRSLDAGVTWSATAAVPASDVVALVPCPGRLLLLARSGGVHASTDGGSSFAAVGAIAAPDLVAGARLGTSVFALSASGSVYRSTDLGVSWSPVGAIPTSSAVGIAAFQGRLFVLTSAGDVGRSDDAGATWTFVGSLSQIGMTALLATPGELVATTAAGEVAASADGAAWTWRGAVHQLTVRALASDQPFPTAVGWPDEPRLAFLAPRPNPARDHTTLAFDLDRSARVTVTVHDLAGREVGAPLKGERLAAGSVRRGWEPGALPAGVYFLRAQLDDRHIVRRIVLLGGR
jgi:hypothetical protein